MENFFKYSFLAVLFLASCSLRQEAYHKSEEPRPQLLERKTAANSGDNVLETDRPSNFGPKDNVHALKCTEDTNSNFNKLGIETLPFPRVAFYDMDGDGLPDMIAGSKDGRLYLYKNSGSIKGLEWQPEPGYFNGIAAGAFSSPAIGDLDGDGKAEVVIGTGGFSSDSGTLLFFKNEGTGASPVWTKIKDLHLNVGNDASVTIVDYNFDGKPDIIAGNSEGRIFFYKNISANGIIRFKKDHSPLGKRSFGMYAVPAAVRMKDLVVLMIGNSTGRLYLFELRNNSKNISVKELNTTLAAKSFAAPAFAALLDKERFDIVLADSDGMLSYFENTRKDFSVFEKRQEMFSNRILAGPACTPTISCFENRTAMVVGNIDGTLTLYDFENTSEGIPWIKRKNYLKGIKLSGFSRGTLAHWNGRELIITGQENGNIKAFINEGSEIAPSWKEERRFFRGIHIEQHSTPTIFDMDNNGMWGLITGAADGKVCAFRIRDIQNNLPVWEEIAGAFDNIKVDGFSTPSLTRYRDVVYLLVGQEDGKIKTYASGLPDQIEVRPFDFSKIKFTETAYLEDINMKTHSSPSITTKDNNIEIAAGDYNGNLRHFTCIPSASHSN